MRLFPIVRSITGVAGWLAVVLLLPIPLASAVPEGSAEAAQRILALREEIARHDEIYFRQASSEIPDAAYDALVRELKRHESAWPEVVAGLPQGPALAAEPESRSPRGSRHEQPMLSLRKAYEKGEWMRFHECVLASTGQEEATYILEPKLDGVAVSLIFENGLFTRALTRGDGRAGEDITAQVAAIGGFPPILPVNYFDPVPALVELRGEIYLQQDRFRELNRQRKAMGLESFATPRSVAAGACQLEDINVVRARRLSLAIFDWGSWQPADGRPATAMAFRELLMDSGFPVVPHAIPVDSRQAGIWDAVQDFVTFLEETLIPSDGAVLKLNDIRLRDQLGYSADFPNWAIACKPATSSAEARILGIEYGIGRTGVLTPVALLEPVHLDGRAVSRVNLYSAGVLRSMDLRAGDTVSVALRGDVIPVIETVVERDEGARKQGDPVPRSCPYCGHSTREEASSGRLYCVTDSCEGVRLEKLAYFAGCIGLDSVGKATIRQLLAAGLVRTPADLYRLSRKGDRLQEILGERAAASLLESVERSRSAPIEHFIEGIGIPGIGKKHASRLAALVHRLAELPELPHSRMEALQRALGPSAAASFRAFFEDPVERNALEALSSVLGDADNSRRGISVLRGDMGTQLSKSGRRLICAQPINRSDSRSRRRMLPSAHWW